MQEHLEQSHAKARSRPRAGQVAFIPKRCKQVAAIRRKSRTDTASNQPGIEKPEWELPIELKRHPVGQLLHSSLDGRRSETAGSFLNPAAS